MLEDKPAEYKEYKEARSGSYTLASNDRDWAHDRAHYNKHGNEVVFMTVQGSSRNETIKMHRNANDITLPKREKIGFILTGEMTS